MAKKVTAKPLTMPQTSRLYVWLTGHARGPTNGNLTLSELTRQATASLGFDVSSRHIKRMAEQMQDEGVYLKTKMNTKNNPLVIIFDRVDKLTERVERLTERIERLENGLSSLEREVNG